MELIVKNPLWRMGVAGLGLFFAFSVTASRNNTVSAQSVVDITGCQDITSSGSYRIANNISVTDPTDGACLIIKANNVTLNGNNKSITITNKNWTSMALDVRDLPDSNWVYSNWHDISVSNFSSNADVRTYGNGVNHVLFDHLTVSAINVLGSDDVTMSNNTVGEGGIQVNDSDTIGWNPFRPIITGNTITGGATNVKVLMEIWGDNIHPCPRLDAVVTNNTITDTRNDVPQEANAAVRIRCATHTTFTGNTIHSTGTTIGLYMRDESDDGVYENNTIWSHDNETHRISSGNGDKTCPARNVFRNNIFRSDNVSTTYFQCLSQGNIWTQNYFWGASGGLAFISGAFGSTFDHNTFYVSSTGSYVQLSYRNASPPDSWTNNIFSYTGTSLFDYDGWVGSPYIGNHNLFQNRAGVVAFGDRGASLSAWKTNNGQDAASIEANPQFTNAANGDFSLQAGSPALNAASDGTNIGAWQTSSCTSAWTCDAWQTCQSNNTQTRTCHDANTCQPPTNQPALTQSCDGTAPTVSITAPANAATVSETVSVTATASDNIGVVGVQFTLDGTNLGSEDTVAPYSTSWNTTTTTNASHTLTAVARDAAGQTTTAITVTVTVNNVVACVEDWMTIPCSGWSGCDKISHTQSRTCTDNHHCGTFVNQPVLSQGCTAQDSTAPSAVGNLQAK